MSSVRLVIDGPSAQDLIEIIEQAGKRIERVLTFGVVDKDEQASVQAGGSYSADKVIKVRAVIQQCRRCDTPEYVYDLRVRAWVSTTGGNMIDNVPLHYNATRQVGTIDAPELTELY